MRTWAGLPPDAMILAPHLTAIVPRRQPVGIWGMLVLAVDIVGDTDPDRAGELALFAGSWIPEQPPADLHDGDLVVRLTHREPPNYHQRRDNSLDIEMLLARQSRWQRVGCWYRANDRWPWLVASTAAAVMGLSADSGEVSAPHDTTPSALPPARGRLRGGLRELLAAGVVKVGDELVWNRHSGIRHTARIRSDGALVLADGRAYGSPSGPTADLGGYPQNGWKLFRTASGHSLDELRTALRTRLGH